MKQILAVAIISLPLGLACAENDLDCPAQGDIPTELSAQLAAGDYELTMVATRGSRRGRAIQAVLHLRQTSKADRSPVTGKLAIDHDLEKTPLYGWIDGDLLMVGAPLCLETEPTPQTSDPVNPGVLVHYPGWDTETKKPSGAPTLVVANIGNRRDGNMWLDGCGIALLVQRNRGGRFEGEWGAWGILHDGRGRFCLRRVPDRPSN